MSGFRIQLLSPASSSSQLKCLKNKLYFEVLLCICDAMRFEIQDSAVLVAAEKFAQPFFSVSDFFFCCLRVKFHPPRQTDKTN